MTPKFANYKGAQVDPEYARLQKQADKEMAQVGTGREYDEYRSQFMPKQESSETILQRVRQISDPQKRGIAYQREFMPVFNRESEAMQARSKLSQERQALRQNFANMGYAPEEIDGLVERYFREKRQYIASQPLFRPQQSGASR